MAQTEIQQAVSSHFSTGKIISTTEEFDEVVDNYRKYQSVLLDERKLDEIIQEPFILSPVKETAMHSDQISDSRGQLIFGDSDCEDADNMKATESPFKMAAMPALVEQQNSDAGGSSEETLEQIPSPSKMEAMPATANQNKQRKTSNKQNKVNTKKKGRCHPACTKIMETDDLRYLRANQRLHNKQCVSCGTTLTPKTMRKAKKVFYCACVGCDEEDGGPCNYVECQPCKFKTELKDEGDDGQRRTSKRSRIS